MSRPAIPLQTLRRLPLFLKYLKSLSPQETPSISATAIADAMGLNDVQVRKDLAAVSCGGRPKVGYNTRDLIHDLEHFLGCEDRTSAVLVGAGNLGRALLGYDGYAQYGLDIIAAFDGNPAVVGTSAHGRQVLPIEKLQHLCQRLKIHIGILAVTAQEAQPACDALVAGGVLAIWNFSSARLAVPPHVLVQDENMAVSLLRLSRHLAQAAPENQAMRG